MSAFDRSVLRFLCKIAWGVLFMVITAAAGSVWNAMFSVAVDFRFLVGWLASYGFNMMPVPDQLR